jgi:hypothetical protein
MRSALRVSMVVLAASVVTVATVSPANASTSHVSAWWNDQKVATAWFNSGNHRPDLGRNSFTVKAEEGSTSATLGYAIDGGAAGTVTVRGSRRERTFSVSGARSRPALVTYRICGVYWGHNVCRDQYDWVR